jgi:hypothetical protein
MRATMKHEKGKTRIDNSNDQRATKHAPQNQ